VLETARYARGVAEAESAATPVAARSQQI